MRIKFKPLIFTVFSLIILTPKVFAQEDEYNEKLELEIEDLLSKDIGSDDSPLSTIQMEEKIEFDFEQLLEEFGSPTIYKGEYPEDENVKHFNKLKKHKKFKNIKYSINYTYGLMIDGVMYPGFTLVFLDQNEKPITYFEYIP